MEFQLVITHLYCRQGLHASGAEPACHGDPGRRGRPRSALECFATPLGSGLASRPKPTVASSSPSTNQAYRLGPLDKVRIRAFEWRASRDEVYDWKAINSDSYTSCWRPTTVPLSAKCGLLVYRPPNLQGLSVKG